MSTHIAPATTRINVMIVEDHLVYRIGLKLIIDLDSGLHVVAEAGNGQAAVSLAQQIHPDVIVMDVSMPILDGIEATRQIKLFAPKTKVLMLTSLDDDIHVFSALSAGADGYCLKDTPSESICAAIKAAHIGVCWLDPAIARKVIMVCNKSTFLVPTPKIFTKQQSKFSLSSRQMEILELVVKGRSNLQMADELGLSSDTIKTHMRNIMDKLAVSDRTQAAVKAIRDGVVKL